MERARLGVELDRNAQAARWVSMLAGVWLFASAYLLDRTAAQRTNTWVMGLIIAAASFYEARMPNLRYVNSLAAVWLFVSAFVLPRIGEGTLWNDLVVAVVVFAASMIGHVARRPLPPARA